MNNIRPILCAILSTLCLSAFADSTPPGASPSTAPRTTPLPGANSDKAMLHSNGPTAPPGSGISEVPVGKVTYVSLKDLRPDLQQSTLGAYPREVQDSMARSASDNPHAMLSSKTVNLQGFGRRMINYASRVRPAHEVEGKLTFKPLDVSATPLGQMKFLGFIPQGPVKNGPWNQITRVFQRSDGVPVFLSEYHYQSDGGTVVVYKESQNTSVGGQPARLSTTPEGATEPYTDLSWTTDERSTTLAVWDALDESPASDRSRPQKSAPGAVRTSEADLLSIANGLK